jgi:hypothetical protein
MLGKRRWLWLLIALVVVASGIVAGVWFMLRDDEQNEDEWQQAEATLLVTEGSATLSTGAQENTVSVGLAVSVRVGDRVTMAEDGEGVLTFFSGEQTFLSPQTVVELEQFETSGDSSQVELHMVLGQAFNTVEKTLDAESRHTITTSAATISVRGTQFIVFVRENDLTQVATADGEVEVSAQDTSAVVATGYGLMVESGKAPGEVRVWGQARINLKTPSGELAALPIVFTNTNNGFIFRYRAGAVGLVSLGTYEVLINSPGPFIVKDIEFPQETTAGTIQEIPVNLSAIVLEVVDEAETPLVDAGPLRVRLTQGDLSGETLVTPGDPILVGPGTWQLEVAQEAQLDQIQTIEVTVAEGEQVTAAVDAGLFDTGADQ